MKINGYTTGSYFYPHDQISSGGAVLGNFGNVSTIESPSKKKNFSRENRASIHHNESPIKVLMPALSPTMIEGTLSKWIKKD
jgi:hypothetical protein